MTIDPQIYTFARERLSNGGWTYSGDVMKLAEILQSCCEEFEAEMEEEMQDHVG